MLFAYGAPANPTALSLWGFAFSCVVDSNSYATRKPSERKDELPVKKSIDNAFLLGAENVCIFFGIAKISKRISHAFAVTERKENCTLREKGVRPYHALRAVLLRFIHYTSTPTLIGVVACFSFVKRTFINSID